MTDHRELAMTAVERAEYMDTNNGAVTEAAIAQVHATLALVAATNAQTAAMERIARQGLSTPVLGQRL